MQIIQIKHYIMSRTKIHKDKAKFKAGFGLTVRYSLQCRRRNFEKGYFKHIRNMKKEAQFAILILLALFASSCRTVKTITVHDVRDSVVYKTITDSFTLLQHDSIFIRQKGDTVFYSKFKTIYKDHIKSDTLRVDVVKIKEVPVNVETIKYKVPKWCWWLVGFNLLALIISFLYWDIKK